MSTRPTTKRTQEGLLAAGASRLRGRLAALAYRSQLGPTREDGWRDFSPRR